MKEKTIKKIFGGMLAALMLFANVANVFAVLTITKGGVMEHKLSLWENTKALDVSKGYSGIEAKIKNNVVEVTMTVSTEGTTDPTAITSARGQVYLTPEIINNFTIKVSTNDKVGYNEATPNLITWEIGDIAINQAETLKYTLTPKDSYSLENFTTAGVSKAKFYVAALYQVIHVENQTFQEDLGTIFKIFEDDTICIPYVVLSETSNPTTGLFTDVIILSAIVVAAAGILVITFKNNKFGKI